MGSLQQRLQAAFVDITLIIALSIAVILCIQYILAFSLYGVQLLGYFFSFPFWFVRNNLPWITFALITIFYGGISESSKYQATFGKRLFGCFVENNNEERLSFWQACLRQCYKVLPFFFFGGIVLADYFTFDIITEAININVVYYTVLCAPVLVLVVSVLLTGSALHDRFSGTRVIAVEIVVDDDNTDTAAFGREETPSTTA
jgi:uncharacterized RDD family membrane protein YckC